MSRPSKNSEPSDLPVPLADAGRADFPIVGIGASAGGLEALEQFLGHVPPDSGIAFVVIQHLDPRHQSIMPELLQRATELPVRQAEDRLAMAPNHVYVIPPAKYLTLTDHTLYLIDPVEPHSRHLPIDYFFRALADEQGEHAIGVILSGMGSDGTLGLRAIRENAGLTLVQEPSSAKFSGMPLSAINAGLADIVGPARKLAEQLLMYVQHDVLTGRCVVAAPEAPSRKDSLDKIFILLRAQTGHDFSLYKQSTLYRRIRRRMNAHQIGSLSDYVRFLKEDSKEIDLLFKDLLIGDTRFFRDPEAWEQLKETELPALFAQNPPGKAMRAWVPGCSTGEEAYSLAIAFKEAITHSKPPGRYALQIFATDLDADAMDKARQAFYPLDIAADVSPERLAHFFIREDRGYRVRKEIREMIVFAPQDVTMDPPFIKLDILSCRNLLTYFSGEQQKKLLRLFHYSIAPGGILFLGSAETIGSATGLFEPVEGTARLFRRSEVAHRDIEVEFPHQVRTLPGHKYKEWRTHDGSANARTLADQLLLKHFAPAAALVNGDGDILYINGRTGKYLELAAGRINWNIYAMAREGLREALILALPQALRNQERVVRRGVRIGTNGASLLIDLTILGIAEPAALAGMAMVVFSDIDTPPAQTAAGTRRQPRGGRITELERALQQAREDSQASREAPQMMREEMQASCEELTSTNEELQSTNEDLQSTNEELITSKEEMLSLNEKLQSVNAELQSKLDELSAAKNDMKNFLDSADLAIVYLDDDLCVRRFTPQATRIFKLIPNDVGRPFFDIITDLVYPKLQDDAREVQRSLALCERQIATKEGHQFMVKIMPYRTLQNIIDGLVITFTDIDRIKRLLEK